MMKPGAKGRMREGVIKRYAEFLPVSEKTPIVTLNEGNTPLIRAVHLGAFAGLETAEIYFKFEGLNPTGSFKDRGMTLAVSKALEEGSRAVICASTGNTSASAAAYAGRARMKCFVLIPEGNIAKGKLLQAYRYGASVFQVRGNFDEALELVKRAAEKTHVTIVNSINPYRIQGQKTVSFEVVDELGRSPDYHLLPVGNAGNITAHWLGYKECKAGGRAQGLPRMCGFQAAGAAPIVLGHRVLHPQTIATAIRIGNPAGWQTALQARDESGGLIEAVTDEEITSAYRYLAENEGIFAEPASCASVAGLIKLAKRNYFRKSPTIVLTLTGTGLKDPDFGMSFSDPVTVVEPKLDALLELLNKVDL
jgi:threonine synthase